MKHYTYKVTFPGMPWYYWGVHTDNGKPYFGSPKTHKWIWKFYEFEVQILERFESREEAEEVEGRLIKSYIEDPNCLNEHWGDCWSEASSKMGALAQPKGVRSSNGVNSQANKTFEERREAGLKAAQTRLLKYGTALNLGMVTESSVSRGGLVSGNKSYDKKEGIFAEGVVNHETCSRGGKAGSAKTNSTRFMCTITGKVSTPGGLSAYQRSRGIDVSLRVKLEQGPEGYVH